MICGLPALEVVRVWQESVFVVLPKKTADSGNEIVSVPDKTSSFPGSSLFFPRESTLVTQVCAQLAERFDHWYLLVRTKDIYMYTVKWMGIYVSLPRPLSLVNSSHS